MSNRHRKKSAPKPTLEQALAQHANQIRALFTEAFRVTIVIRYPPDPDAEIVISDDQPEYVITVLQRRRDQVLASQAAKPDEPAA